MDRVSVHDLRISTRTSNVLRQCRIEFIDQLENLTSQDLLDFSHFGPKSVREIRKELALYGTCLKDDYMASTENEKKLIEGLPNVIEELVKNVKDLERKVKILYYTLEQLHFNINPKNN